MVTGKRERSLLRLILKGVIVSYSSFDPVFRKTDLYKDLVYDRRRRYAFKARLHNLEQKGLIILGGERIALSSKGQELLDKIEREDITLDGTKWDGVWRMVAYDIPNEHKKERDYFRAKLKQLGFCQVQKSLWAIPFECKEEIAVFAQSLGVAPFVIYLTTDNVPNQEKMKSRFGLK
jgi:DNA-binding transcriptional regulator PaaX